MSTMTQGEIDDARRQLIQRLEGLRRAGVERIPRPPAGRSPVVASVVETAVIELPPRPAPVHVEVSRPAPPPVLATATSLFAANEQLEALVPVEDRPARLAALAQEVAACVRCPLLVANRSRTVFGEGSPAARLMFVGEGPGADEDRTGRPFIGKAGMLLTDMIVKGMKLTREEVYIANIVKSRPPENRNPEPDEIANCLPYLEQQIAIIRPEFLCLLGKVAASTLLETAMPMNRMRSRWHSYRGIPTIVTWHPAYLLRQPAAKKEAWDDLQMLMKRMGLPTRERK